MVGIVGFCNEEEKLFGPDQLYVALAMVCVVKLSVCKAQIGEFTETVGEIGAALTVTATVPVGLVHPFALDVTEYTPEAAVVAPTIDGF
jgi:hypothetical protein